MSETEPKNYGPILAGTPDTILGYVFSEPLSPGTQQQLTLPDSYFNTSISSVWSGEQPSADMTPSFSDPKYIGSANPEDYEDISLYREAMLTEFRGRSQEWVYWQMLGSLIGRVENPEDFFKLADVFDYMFQNSLHAKDVITPPTMACRIINRSSALLTDPFEWNADPNEVASMSLPSILYLLDRQMGYETTATSGQASKALSTPLLTNGVEGTVERVASLRIRDRLHEMGYPGFGENRSSRRQSHSLSERYLLRTALIRISGNGLVGHSIGLPTSGADVLDVIQGLTLRTVQEQANAGNVIANQLIGAFEQISSGRGYKVKGVASTRGLPIGAVIHVANVLSTQLNNQHNLSGDQELQQLDRNDLTELPAAFQRILYAMDPALLNVATELVPLDGSPDLRRRMVYIEALSGQWKDLDRIPGPTIGDYVLRMYARGQRAETIRQGLRLLAEGSPDRVNSQFRGIRKDPRTSEKRVVAEHRRPGWGFIS